jgi:hypothetical protein
MDGRRLVVWVALGALLGLVGCRAIAGYDPARDEAGTVGDGGAGADGGDGAAPGDGVRSDGRPPQPTCTSPAALVDTSQPDRIVGDGTKASCTAAELIKAVKSGGVITFDCGVEAHTITLAAPLTIELDTTVDGGDRIALSGGSSVQVFELKPGGGAVGPHLRLQRLTLRDGRGGAGGAIEQHGGALTVVGCRFEDNMAESSWGGAIFSMQPASTIVVDSDFLRNVASSGGAIGVLHGGLKLSGSRLLQNQATRPHGLFPGFGGAVAITNAQEVEVCGCRFADNKAQNGGALYTWDDTPSSRTEVAWSTVIDNTSENLGGGLWLGTATVLLRQSLIAANRAVTSGGGLFVTAGSVPVGVDLVLRNVTVTANRAPLGAGMHLGVDVAGEIRGATIAENVAEGAGGYGSGIYGGSQSLTLRGSIVANNTVVDGSRPINCAGLLADGGGNFQYPMLRADGSSDDPSALCAATVRREAPKLFPLAENGGPTQTMAPSPQSPVIGASGSCLPIDQRGELRPTPCASGASEP